MMACGLGPRMTRPTRTIGGVDEAAVRASIVAAGRRLRAAGLIAAGEGNISLLLGDDVVVTPSGRRKDELVADDLVVVPAREGASESVGGGDRDRRPSSDLAIHRAVRAARPDAIAVVHAHLPAAMALTLAGEVPDSAVLPETAMFLGPVPTVAFLPPGSTELAAAVVAALTGGPGPRPTAVLLERHGAIAIGPTVETAVDRLELVEVLCRTWLDALLVRAARVAIGPGPLVPSD
jgi:L-fuculose-phosphate aldolase